MSDPPGAGAGTTSFDATRAPSGAPPGPGKERHGKGLTVAVSAVIGVLLAASIVVTVVIVTHRPHHVQPPAHPLSGTIFQLRPGQCINSLPNGTAVAHAVPCAQPHYGEIYGAFRVAGRHWPGTAALSEQARQGCQSRLSGYLGTPVAPGGMAEFYVYPDSGAWAAGGRSVICEIRSTQGELTGSVRASGG
jgi:Septum formation